MGIWDYDPHTARVHWDDRMLEIYDITDGQNERPDEFWETHIHPDDLADTQAYAEDCRDDNADFRRDYRLARSLARSVMTPDGPSKLIGVNIDVTEDYLRAEELKTAQRQLKHEARHDALTGLANRRRLDEVTQALFNRVTPQDRYCVMHLDLDLDLDHFKQINDTQAIWRVTTC